MDYCIKCSQPLFHGTIPHRCIADIPCPSCASLRARIEGLEKVVDWACVRLGIVNDPAYSGYTHDLCNEVIAELRRRADAAKGGKGLLRYE